MMKNIFLHLSLALTAVFFTASCNLNPLPEFSDKDAFVAFDVKTVRVAEDEGSVEIPVSLASIHGMEATIKYDMIANDSETAAKEGVNFKFTDTEKTLTFNAEKRTDVIKLEIMKIDGFTGDLTLSLQFTDTGKLNQGSENVCNITITDIDHPLSSILGTYSVTGTTKDDETFTWDMTFLKDPDDIDKVWVDGMTPRLVGKEGGFYGIAKKDSHGNVTAVEFELGQVHTSETYSSWVSGVCLYGVSARINGDYHVIYEGKMIIKFSNGGQNLVVGEDYGPGIGGVKSSGSHSFWSKNRFYPGSTGVKK